MSTLTELKYDILASLYYKSATITELMSRDFLKNISRYGVDRMIHSLDMDGYIYYRGKEDTMHVYKSAEKTLNERGYEVS